MNPLNRRMFRQPGMSRQPAGILASSPQLANTVANRQPVRMANGGTNTYTAAVQRAVQAGDKRSIQELSKPSNYGDAARTPDAQNALRMATQALGKMTQISTAPSVAPRSVGSYVDQGIAAAKNVGRILTTPTDDLPMSNLIASGQLPDELTGATSSKDQNVMDGGAPRFNPDGMSSQEDLGRGSRESDLMGSKEDTQFFGPGETLSKDIVDFETSPDKKDAGDDEAGMPVPTSKPKRKESTEIKVKKLDKLVDAEVMGTKLDKMFVGEVGSILNSDVSEEEKNDNILEVMGEKDPDKKLTMEERVQKNIALYEKYFPEDDADKFDMNDFAISFGIALATGESPNLITNAANAAKTALGEKAESDKTRKTRKDKLRMLGLTKAFDDEKDEKQWSRELEKISINQKYDWTKTLFSNKKDLEKFNAKMAFDKTSLYAKLNTQIDIANANADNQAAREEASQAAALIRAKIGALSDAHAAAYVEFEGQDLTKPEVAAAFHKKADEIADSLAKTSNTMQKDYSPQRIEFEVAKAVQGQIDAMIKGGERVTPEIRSEITKQVRGTFSQALQGSQGNSGSANIPSYDTKPDADTLQILGDAGITQIKIGGELYPINRN